MADRRDLDFTYSLTDRIIRLSLGELADFSGAKFDGDFSLSLEAAQRRKHESLAEQIGLQPDQRILDLGCGWGGLLDYIRRRGAAGIGLTLSSAQADACRRHGLDVRLQDARRVSRDEFGEFDGAASLGAFERLDYIETVNQWNARVRARSLRKALLKLRLVPRWLTSTDFRLAFTSGVSANQICFERELTDHFRLVFEKTS